jgi:hypothetical protein
MKSRATGLHTSFSSKANNSKIHANKSIRRDLIHLIDSIDFIETPGGNQQLAKVGHEGKYNTSVGISNTISDDFLQENLTLFGAGSAWAGAERPRLPVASRRPFKSGIHWLERACAQGLVPQLLPAAHTQ